MNTEFVYIDEYVPDIRWDAKYATWDNFTGKPVDGYMVNRIIGSRALCNGILAAQRYASSLGFGLLLWDGYRPQRAVNCFMEWSKLPDGEKLRQEHYPNMNKKALLEQGYIAMKSSHSRGCAIDLSLYRLDTGELVPMGGEFDLMDPISHHDAQGIRKDERDNRNCLRTIMENSGFVAYQNEWWHYSLKNEPYPDTYFDFPVA